jgi:hypothetical protein
MAGRFGRRMWLSAALIAGLALTAGSANVASQSIQFDLRTIGESIYEAHTRTGRWPARVDDLEGTAYLRLPYRRDLLERDAFVVVWQPDLTPDRVANRDRILAYDNTSVFARLGWIWACRGDLSIDRISTRDAAALRARSQ